MKTFPILCLAMFFFLSAYSQEYNYGACFIDPNFFKLEGKIKMTDSIVEISSTYKGSEKVDKYTIVKKVNGIVYLTDGIMTHSIKVTPESGKKKGFEYDNLVMMYFDKNQQGGIQNMIYYSKLIQ